MRINFTEEFGYELGGKYYEVEVCGCRETDENGRIFAELSYLLITDEAGNEVTDTSDVYNEIAEYVCYDREYSFESYGFDNDYDDEEEIPTFGRSC